MVPGWHFIGCYGNEWRHTNIVNESVIGMIVQLCSLFTIIWWFQMTYWSEPLVWYSVDFWWLWPYLWCCRIKEKMNYLIRTNFRTYLFSHLEGAKFETFRADLFLRTLIKSMQKSFDSSEKCENFKIFVLETFARIYFCAPPCCT